MRAMRRAAWEVNLGDEVLLRDRPRTWQRVTEVEIIKGDRLPVRIDTDRSRTYWEMNDLLPWRGVR